MTAHETALYIYDKLIRVCIHEVSLSVHCHECSGKSRWWIGSNERTMLGMEASLDILELQMAFLDKE